MTQTGFLLEPQADDLVVMERRFDAALLSRDVQALDAILAERFFLNDFMGGVIIRSELLKYIVPHELSVQRYGDAGLVTGWTEMKTELQGEVSEVKSRFLHVYIKHAGSWQLVSAQGTVIPELD